MKTLTTLLIVLYACTGLLGQSKTDTLTNDKVIRLAKLGLQSSIIIQKIQTSFTLFDVGTDALIQLSDQGVSPEVINEMMATQSKAELAMADQKDMNDPNTHRATGIYYYNPKDNEKPIRRVDPTIASSLKSGGFGNALARAYSYGLANEQLKSSLAGANSRTQIQEGNPVFYFYFDNNPNPNADNWFFASATSPNEFVLLKLTEKKANREVVIGTANSYGSSSGINNKNNQDFTYDEVAPGVYKVTLTKPLKTGEYCFQYASLTPSRYDNNKVFDFGISIPGE